MRVPRDDLDIVPLLQPAAQLVRLRKEKPVSMKKITGRDLTSRDIDERTPRGAEPRRDRDAVLESSTAHLIVASALLLEPPAATSSRLEHGRRRLEFVHA